MSALARVAAVGAAALALTLGLSTAPAQAAPSETAALAITRDYPGRVSDIATSGRMTMSRADAQRLLATGHRVEMRLLATTWVPFTPSSVLIDWGRGVPYPTDGGLDYYQYRWDVPDDLLDVYGPVPPHNPTGLDPLLVEVRLVEAAGRTVRSVQSPVLVTWYS